MKIANKGRMPKKRELTPEEEIQLKNLEVYQKHHGKPLSRREFLASGAVLSAASLVLPSALSLVSRAAYAQSCPVANLPGFVTINLTGGASLAGNAMALDTGRSYLSTYGDVGLGSGAAATDLAQKPFGEMGPSFSGISGFLAGLSAEATMETRLNTASMLVCVRLTDDTANNQIDPTPMIQAAKSGADAFLPPLGDNRNQPAILAAVPSLGVNNLADIENAIGVQGAVSNLTADQKSKIFRAIDRLSASQARKLAGVTGGDLLAELIQTATGKNFGLIASPSGGTDPRTQAGLANIWNFNNNQELRDAGVVYNTLKGNSVAAYIERGGYDYHLQGRANQDTKDTEAGQIVGRILQTAAVMSQRVCVMVTSDGSVRHTVSSAPGSEPTSDDGTHGMAYVFFYDPVARPAQSDSQLGAYSVGGNGQIGVNESTLIGGSPPNAIGAIVANYMSFAGLAGSFESVAPGLFTTEQLSGQIIKIG